MKVLKFLISVYVWITAGGMFFLATLFGIVAFRVIPAAKINFFYKQMLRSVFFFALVRIKRVNTPEAEKGTTYLYLANHTSIADVPLMGAYLPTFANAIEAQSHFRWPLYRHLITGYGQIPINRESVRESLKSMQEALDRLKNGRSIIIFPEGHRTRTGEMQEFKKLPFVIAKKSGVPIIPISVSGMWRLSPGDKFEKNPTKITMYFHNPILPEAYEKLSADELKLQVFDMIKSRIE